MLVADKIGIEQNDFVARIHRRGQRQQQSSAGAAGDHHLTIVVTELLAKIRADFVAQSGDARAGGVGIFATIDRIDGGLFDRLRGRRNRAGQC